MTTPSLRYGHYSAGFMGCDFLHVRHMRDFIERHLREHVRTGSRVADVGCGRQPWRPLVTYLGGTYMGIDIAQNRENSVDIVAPIDKVPVPDAAFDVILCTEVLEHVPDIRAAFWELARLTAPRGVVIVTTPFAYPIHGDPWDFARHTPYQLTACAEANHLQVEEMVRAGNPWEVIVQTLEHALPTLRGGRYLVPLVRGLLNPLLYWLGRMSRTNPDKRIYLNTMCLLSRSGQ